MPTCRWEMCEKRENSPKWKCETVWMCEKRDKNGPSAGADLTTTTTRSKWIFVGAVSESGKCKDKWIKESKKKKKKRYIINVT
jgi:hypothetical protein